MSIRYLPLGSVSHGTLRSEDLADAFITCIRYEISKRKAAHFQAVWNRIQRMPTDTPAVDVDKCEAEEEFIDAMCNFLDAYGKPFTYFGAHKGDGSDFGCWINWDDVREATFASDMGIMDGITPVNDTSEITGQPRKRFYLHTNDHGNVTLYWKRSNGTLKEVWSCV